MQERHIYLSERLATAAAAMAISIRGVPGAVPAFGRATRQEHDGTLSRGFYAMARLYDGNVVHVDTLPMPARLAA